MCWATPPDKAAHRSQVGLLRLTAALYLVAVGGVFVGGYQLTLRHAMRVVAPGDSATSLDQWVPLWPWSIVPYCSINLVYVVAFFVCYEPAALRRLASRLLSVQCGAFVVFWLFPCRMQRSVPALEGLPAMLYQWLGHFDQPYNLLPSLHIAVLGVLWRTLLPWVPLRWRGLWHGWAVVVAVSALTTGQHHVLDVVAGALLAWLVLWASTPAPTVG